MSRRRPYHIILILAGILAIGSGVLWWQDYRRNRQPRLDYALIQAIKAGETAQAIALLDSGADPNAFEIFPPKSGLQRVEELLHGKPSVVHGVMFSAQTPLELAADGGQVEVVRALLKKGARVDERRSLLTGPALIFAADKGQIEIVRLLLDNGADPNAQGYTNEHGPALSSAVAKNNVALVKLLLERGADPNGGYKEGGDIYWSARINHQTQIIALLERAGAKEEKSVYYPPRIVKRDR